MRDIATNYMTPPPTQLRFIRRSSLAFFNDIDPFEKYSVDDRIITQIFKYLSFRDLGACMRVSKRFNRVASQSAFWNTVIIKKASLPSCSFHRLLSRGVRKLQMRNPSSLTFPLYSTIKLPQIYEKLVYLDLSSVVYQDSSILLGILQKTTNLQILNIAYYPYLDDEHCSYIAQNRNLYSLNIEYCNIITMEGAAELCQCEELEELDMSWTKIGPGTIQYLSRNLPPGLRALNMAGRFHRELTDDFLSTLLETCTELEELDISDCPDITEDIVGCLKAHSYLKNLSISRCYGIEPVQLTQLKGLEILNVYGCVTDEGINYLKDHLHPTKINESPFCSIARHSLVR